MVLTFDAAVSDDVIHAYRTSGCFEFVERCGQMHIMQSRVVPTDTYYFPYQWGLYNDGQFKQMGIPGKDGADIAMYLAWALEQGDSSIIVAILDSGIRPDHPEFRGRLWKNPGEIPDNGIDDDNNKMVDDTYGWDFAEQDNAPTDVYGHGTNVAGIIGGKANNWLGFAGIDWNCKLMICKTITDSGIAGNQYAAAAIYYAVEKGARILNLSFGSPTPSTVLKEAIEYASGKNVIMVAAMGNDNDSTKYYPAAYPQTIAVGATNWNDRRSHPFYGNPFNALGGSNFGDHIDVVAPGNYIYGPDCSDTTNWGRAYSGTSLLTLIPPIKTTAFHRSLKPAQPEIE
jgi:subtilisin family serine protease